MIIFSYSQARQNLSSLLNKAKEEGEVMIKRKDGSTFILKSVSAQCSPLDVEGIDTGITRDEIVDIQREIRNR
ncbi:MAG: type II toxin-antitoxin system Phd/YefM family antitoxin [Candidatus Lokiarchaeota archaeon]|nr:type II toxin-antitoxin system Phd/YefM family antitoxin [Candidatus Lokiarchaeota archaeon]